jgi:tetratricopeptide (TPR) repeat protein
MTRRHPPRSTRWHRAPACAALTVLVAIAALPAAADSHRALFARGNAAFARGDHAAAAQSYEQLVESGVDDPDVYYDLALSHAKAGAHGRALYALERALLVAPGDDAAEAAIASSQAALGRRRAAANGEATVQTRPPFREAAVRGVHADTLAILVLALSALFFGALVALRFVRGETPRLVLWIAAPLLGLGLGIAGLGLAQKVGIFDAGDAAIALDEDLALREAPDPRASTRGLLHEGERVRVVGRDRGWARVRAAGGREGWLRDDALGTLRHDKR